MPIFAPWMSLGFVIKNLLLGARPGLETQPRYKAPGDLRVETRITNVVINIRLRRWSSRQWTEFSLWSQVADKRKIQPEKEI